VRRAKETTRKRDCSSRCLARTGATARPSTEVGRTGSTSAHLPSHVSRRSAAKAPLSSGSMTRSPYLLKNQPSRTRIATIRNTVAATKGTSHQASEDPGQAVLRQPPEVQRQSRTSRRRYHGSSRLAGGHGDGRCSEQAGDEGQQHRLADAHDRDQRNATSGPTRAPALSPARSTPAARP
jgi:hypothetical protein